MMCTSHDPEGPLTVLIILCAALSAAVLVVCLIMATTFATISVTKRLSEREQDYEAVPTEE